jgi:hypothetical protein
VPNTQLPDAVDPIAVTNLVGFGTQGLEASDVNNCSGSTAHWCGNFASFYQNVWTEVQTLAQTCPTEGTGVSCTGLQGSTGPLPPLLNYAAGKHAVIFEIYYQDWLLSRSDSGYCTAASGANYSSGQCGQIQPPYAAAVLATAQGSNSLYNSGP